MNRTAVGTCFALFLLLSVGEARATTVLRADVEELTRVSNLVVRAVVREVDERVALLHGGPFRTRVELEVLEGLKDRDRHRTLTLELPGGEGAGLIMRIPGMPRFRVGEEIVVFLESVAPGRYAVAGLTQGVFRVRRDGTVWRNLDGVAMVERRDGIPRRHRPLPTTLDELKTRVREVEP